MWTETVLFHSSITKEDVGKGWAVGGSHGDSVDLAMHNIIEVELDRRSEPEGFPDCKEHRYKLE